MVATDELPECVEVDQMGSSCVGGHRSGEEPVAVHLQEGARSGSARDGVLHNKRLGARFAEGPETRRGTDTTGVEDERPAIRTSLGEWAAEQGLALSTLPAPTESETGTSQHLRLHQIVGRCANGASIARSVPQKKALDQEPKVEMAQLRRPTIIRRIEAALSKDAAENAPQPEKASREVQVTLGLPDAALVQPVMASGLCAEASTRLRGDICVCAGGLWRLGLCVFCQRIDPLGHMRARVGARRGGALFEDALRLARAAAEASSASSIGCAGFADAATQTLSTAEEPGVGSGLLPPLATSLQLDTTSVSPAPGSKCQLATSVARPASNRKLIEDVTPRRTPRALAARVRWEGDAPPLVTRVGAPEAGLAIMSGSGKLVSPTKGHPKANRAARRAAEKRQRSRRGVGAPSAQPGSGGIAVRAAANPRAAVVGFAYPIGPELSHAPSEGVPD